MALISTDIDVDICDFKPLLIHRHDRKKPLFLWVAVALALHIALLYFTLIRLSDDADNYNNQHLENESLLIDPKEFPKSYLYVPPKVPQPDTKKNTLQSNEVKTKKHDAETNLVDSTVTNDQLITPKINILRNKAPINKSLKRNTQSNTPYPSTNTQVYNPFDLRSVVQQQLKSSQDQQTIMEQDAEELSIESNLSLVEGPVFSQEYIDQINSNTTEIDCSSSGKKALATFSGLLGGNVRCQNFNQFDKFIQKRLQKLPQDQKQ